MHLLSVYLLAHLGAVEVASAQQAVLDGGGGSCLSAAGGNRVTSMVSCCPTDSHEGKGSVGGTVFTYACNKFANVFDKIPKNAPTPRDCAQICSEDPSCIAGTWHGMKGQCYTTSEGSSFVPIGTAKFILITKTQEQTGDDSLRPNPDGIAHYNEEKDTIRKDMANQCEMKVKGLASMHQDALRQTEDRCKAEKALLEQD